eukprot:jgi/Mesvir1/13540/Mv04527-RA.1
MKCGARTSSGGMCGMGVPRGRCHLHRGQRCVSRHGVRSKTNKRSHIEMEAGMKKVAHGTGAYGVRTGGGGRGRKGHRYRASTHRTRAGDVVNEDAQARDVVNDAPMGAGGVDSDDKQLLLDSTPDHDYIETALQNAGHHITDKDRLNWAAAEGKGEYIKTATAVRDKWRSREEAIAKANEKLNKPKNDAWDEYKRRLNIRQNIYSNLPKNPGLQAEYNLAVSREGDALIRWGRLPIRKIEALDTYGPRAKKIRERLDNVILNETARMEGMKIPITRRTTTWKTVDDLKRKLPPPHTGGLYFADPHEIEREKVQEEIEKAELDAMRFAKRMKRY